jgi:hypothetical protein
MSATRTLICKVFLILCLLAATTLLAEPTAVEVSTEPALAPDCAPVELDLADVVLACTTEVALNDFCDTSPNYGTTASCEAALVVPAGTCPNGISSKGCRKVGNACSSGGSPGKWCQNCYVKCKTRCAVDEEPIGDIEPIDP